MDIVASFIVFSGFMPELINLGRLKKQQIQVERSRKLIICREYLPRPKGRIQKGLRFNQNILLSIPEQRACPEEAEKITIRDPKAHARKVYLEYKSQPIEPITQQDALPKSEGPPRYLQGQDPLSLTRIDEVETSIIDPDAITNAPKTAPRVIIKAHAPFPYKDSRQVPWKYNCEVSEPVKADKTEENVNEVGNFTRSGRCYSTHPNVETVKNQKGKAPGESSDKNFDDEPIPEYHAPVKESEAKEFLKTQKHSEFNVVDQLNRLPARISMFSLLLSSELHRNALLKILNQTFIPKEISVDNVDRLVGNIAIDNFLSFSDEEIPAGGKGSHKALHITTRCKGYMLLGVLVDNGSTLNVLPLATLKKLPIDNTHMKPYQNTVRAFDGTQHEVIGKIEVPLMIRPSEYEVDFVVMDIKPTYSCLLGRPWIHAAGAVPSTLHQKLKFVIDGKLVTIKAEEDIIASISSNAPYIEVDEDAVECTFRSLELVNATFVEENKRMAQFRLSRCAKMQVRQTYGKGHRLEKASEEGYREDYTQYLSKEGGNKEESRNKESKAYRRGSTMG
ncbi:hypothetical protein GQ457_12G016210 [Hibiscus cannabinus]